MNEICALFLMAIVFVSVVISSVQGELLKCVATNERQENQEEKKT